LSKRDLGKEGGDLGVAKEALVLAAQRIILFSSVEPSKIDGNSALTRVFGQ